MGEGATRGVDWKGSDGVGLRIGLQPAALDRLGNDDACLIVRAQNVDK